MEEAYLFDSFAILRRWKKIFLITTAVLFALSAAFVMHWSNYRSTAVVQIEQPEISANATAPTGASPRDAMEAAADHQVSVIAEKVLATSSLIDIITKFDLYSNDRKHLPIANVADDMRKKIKVGLVSDTMDGPASASGSPSKSDDMSAIAFKLSFDYSDPLVTQQVTDELVTRFLDEDLKERRTGAEETSAFLDAQITAMEKSLSEQEQKIADFQKTNGASRPEDLAFNQQAAASLNISLQNLDGQITSNEGTVGSLRAQLAGIDPYSRVIADGQVLTTPSVQLKALQSQYASLTAQYGPEHPDVIKVRHQIEALRAQVGGKSQDISELRAQIADTQTNLAVAQKTYGPDHPDVIALKSQLQKLQSQLALHHSAGTAAGTGIVADADNPAYLQVVAEIHAAEEQHKALLEQRKEMQAQQEGYQKAIIENPASQQEMAALTRDYDNAQMRYRELKEKKMAADMDLQMQQARQGQRLSLVDPPELPLKTQPARIMLLIGSLFLSVIGGIGAVIIAQSMKQSIVGVRHLESIVGVAPLVAIPHIYTHEERKQSLQNILLQKTGALWDNLTQRLGQSKGEF